MSAPDQAAVGPELRRSTTLPIHVGGQAQKRQRDELIMDTNKSSIVSKRSVEKLYYQRQPEYFRYFVSKFKRRSPLINRGYWLRMKAIEHGVSRFLAERTAKRKVVVNLGCGYDPMPFLFLGKQHVQCQAATFVDVDYPVLMQNKMGIIQNTDQLRALLPKFTTTGKQAGLLASSDPYVAIGCDLADMEPMKLILRQHLGLEGNDVAVLFVSEVSTAYMEREASQALFCWSASLPDVRFCLLEQHLPDGPDHPFAATMLAHFEKLRTPLRAVGTMEQMKLRFVAAGYPEAGTEIRSLWELWSDPVFLSAEERRRLDRVEPFDEWEEFALFASHYFLLYAEKEPGRDYTYQPYRATRASLFAGSSKGSILSSPTTSSWPDTPQHHVGPGDILQTHELLAPHTFRRYASVIPPLLPDSSADSVGLHGGLGTQARLDTCTTYSSGDAVQPIHGPPLRHGLMCHQITRLGGTANCMLTGGRTSPDQASAEAWLRLDANWRRVQDLPSGRYRHSAVPLVLPTDPRPAHTVLIFGGRTSDGHVLDEWLIWTGETGWRRVTVQGDERPPARFGATMITDSREGVSGVLVGGMTSAGRVLNDLWHWTLESDMTLICKNVTARATAFLKADGVVLGRFGAQLVRSNRGILMVGGITDARMLTRQDEILNLKTLRPQPIQGPRPLFIGHTLHDVDGGLLVLGGGATCFSFGTTWNRSCLLNDARPGGFDMQWRMHSTVDGGKASAEQSTIFVESPTDGGGGGGAAADRTGHTTSSPPSPATMPPPSPATATTPLPPPATATMPLPSPATTPMPPPPPATMPPPIAIPQVRVAHGIDFTRYVEAARPLVLRQCQIGSCTTAWTTAYLKDAVGADCRVSVHAATTARMDFGLKNFQYVTQDWGSFLDAVERGDRLYLRALSPSRDRPTRLEHDFPPLAPDFHLPPELAYVAQHAHSSPLRISGPVHMWLHYDVMANVYCQVRGRKRFRLFPPADVSHLAFAAGASTSALDAFAPDAAATASLAHTTPHDATLHPGDVLFIPPLWAHTSAPAADDDAAAGPSVAVNVFFRSLPADGCYAAGRDVYGNRDLAAYEHGRHAVAKLLRSFDHLPRDVAGFYLERLAHEMLDQARAFSRSAALHAVYAELGE